MRFTDDSVLLIPIPLSQLPLSAFRDTPPIPPLSSSEGRSDLQQPPPFPFLISFNRAEAKFVIRHIWRGGRKGGEEVEEEGEGTRRVQDSDDDEKGSICSFGRRMRRGVRLRQDGTAECEE